MTLATVLRQRNQKPLFLLRGNVFLRHLHPSQLLGNRYLLHQERVEEAMPEMIVVDLHTDLAKETEKIQIFRDGLQEGDNHLMYLGGLREILAFLLPDQLGRLQGNREQAALAGDLADHRGLNERKRAAAAAVKKNCSQWMHPHIRQRMLLSQKEK
tara:strand:- start:1307 stop:1774 length:468 start_codon:yes stop_codon:yes gene_type:complete